MGRLTAHLNPGHQVGCRRDRCIFNQSQGTDPGVFVAPLLVWIAVRAGEFRDRVPELLRTVAPLLFVAFTRDLYLGLLVLALLGFVDGDGPIRKFMTWRLAGPWHASQETSISDHVVR